VLILKSTEGRVLLSLHAWNRRADFEIRYE
jgi:hypothetical protein